MDAGTTDDLSGCTDEEWIARRAKANGVPADRLERAAELLRTTERVKYGMEVPTRWAAQEAVEGARQIVAECEEDAS